VLLTLGFALGNPRMKRETDRFEVGLLDFMPLFNSKNLEEGVG
jgi:hypothetical protein